MSRRRILQVLKTKQINTPGRKREELSPETVQLILDLKRQGYTIEEIQNYLSGVNINVSKYKVWSTLREQKTRKLSGEINKMFKKWDSIIAVILLHPKAGTRRLKLLLILDIRNCKILLWVLTESLRLRNVIELLDSVLESNMRNRIHVVISRTPPLVPTRGHENKLTRHLKKLRITYHWITSEDLVRIQKRITKRLSRNMEPEQPEVWFEKSGIALIERYCSEYVKLIGLEVGKDEIPGET
ncbi:hypothetical protein [Thermococcus sp. MV11]|uniref:hypothetical protein n=1 Tax=Thermococcus sp. MV11 TaxID=1638267 RepID=UPI00142FDE08|nr:hypothetical protein [Thermococcus sp. MV11]NJE03392.1 hypothetical protein [Thermococcus sp. MV11]